MRTSSDKQNFHKYLERKGGSAVRRENASQKRLSEAEADMEIRRWEQKSSEVALYETHRELQSQRLHLHAANIRLKETKKKACMEKWK